MGPDFLPHGETRALLKSKGYHKVLISNHWTTQPNMDLIFCSFYLVFLLKAIAVILEMTLHPPPHLFSNFQKAC